MGSPAISASGLPGSRCEAMRAGIRMRTSAIGLPWRSVLAAPARAKMHRGLAGYTGCQRRGKPAICAPPQPAAAAGARRAKVGLPVLLANARQQPDVSAANRLTDSRKGRAPLNAL